tara:strand:- start:209 stop:3037 length:2829 start_codon:yes stop_codon:yes gene_type:complete
MLNVAKGIYGRQILPVPMVKEVAILPVKMIEGELKQLSLEVTVILQISAEKKYESPFNLNVTALMDVSKLDRYKGDLGKVRLRGLASGDNEVITNVKIDNLTRNVSKTYYNSNESSALVYKTVVVPITLTTTETISDLTLIVFTNEIALQEDGTTPMSLTLQNTPFNVSTPVFEDVLRRGDTLKMSRVFKLLDTMDGYGNAGEIWPGAVHVSGSNLMAGRHHTNDAHPRVQGFPTLNQKIKDYRGVGTNNVLKGIPISDNRQNYLSEVLYSRSTSGLLNLYFSFDLLGYARNMGAFSHLIKNNTTLLSAMDLKEVKVYRNRVNADDVGNVLTPALRDHLENCQDSQKKLIARRSGGSVLLVTGAAAATPGTVEMVATDAQVPQELENYFSYEIVIELLDNSAATLWSVVDMMESEVAEFEDYLDVFSNRGKKGYDINSYQLAAQKRLSGNNSWKMLLNTYLSALSFLGVSGDLESTAREMIIFGSPNSADQRSLMTFQTIIGDFIGGLRAFLTAPAVGKSSAKPAFGSKISASSASSRRLKYSAIAKSKYHNQFNKKTGFDYLGPVAQTSRGLPRVPYNTYQTRVSKEVARYSVSSPVALNINRYGFLAPTEIKTNTNNIEANREMEFKQSLDLLQASLSPGATSLAYNYIGNPNVPTVTKTDINALLALNGVSYDVSCEEKTQLQAVYNAVPGSPESRDSSLYLSSGSSFVRDDQYLQAAASGSEELRYRSFTDAPDRLLDSDVVHILLEKSADGYRTPNVVDLSNIQGSLAHAELSATTEAFDSMNPLEQNINFNAIARIEYLRTFGARGRPRWALLSAAAFTRAMERNISLLCRIVGPVRVLDIPNPFQLGPYSSVFVIGDSPLPPRQSSPPPLEILNNTKNQTRSLFSLGSLNYKGAGSAVLPQYLCSPSTIRGENRLLARHARRSTTSAAAIPTGGY